MPLPSKFAIIQPWTPVPANSGLAHAGYAFPVGTTFDRVTMSVEGEMGIAYYQPDHANGMLYVQQGEHPAPMVAGVERLTREMLLPTFYDGNDPINCTCAAKGATPDWARDRQTVMDTLEDLCLSLDRSLGGFDMEIMPSLRRSQRTGRFPTDSIVLYLYWQGEDRDLTLRERDGGVAVDVVDPRARRTVARNFFDNIALEDAVNMITGVGSFKPTKCWCGETRTEKNHEGWDACAGCGTV